VLVLLVYFSSLSSSYSLAIEFTWSEQFEILLSLASAKNVRNLKIKIGKTNLRSSLCSREDLILITLLGGE